MNIPKTPGNARYTNTPNSLLSCPADIPDSAKFLKSVLEQSPVARLKFEWKVVVILH